MSKKPNLQAQHLDARGDLLIGCRDIAAQTADGERFQGMKVVNHALLRSADPTITTEVSG